MKKIIYSILVATIIGTCLVGLTAFKKITRGNDLSASCPKGEKWYNFLSIDAKVSMDFPNVYKQTTTPYDNGKIISVKCYRGKDQFILISNISVVWLPEPYYTSTVALENMAKRLDAHIIKMYDYKYDKLRGREGVFRDREGMYYYRSVVSVNILYEILVFTPNDNIKDDIQRFFDSFMLKAS